MVSIPEPVRPVTLSAAVHGQPHDSANLSRRGSDDALYNHRAARDLEYHDRMVVDHVPEASFGHDAGAGPNRLRRYRSAEDMPLTMAIIDNMNSRGEFAADPFGDPIQVDRRPISDNPGPHPYRSASPVPGRRVDSPRSSGVLVRYPERSNSADEVTYHNPGRGAIKKPPPKPQVIFFYESTRPHYGFTNFSPHEVTFRGKLYPTSEHLFQAFKFLEHRPLLAEHIRTAGKQARVALSEARRFNPEVRRDWFEKNVEFMELALRYKFEQHPNLRRELMGTGDAFLVENAGANDAFWGNGADGNGRNELGLALMRLRDHFARSQRQR